MFNKICPNCENECREVDPRCKECGYQFMMLCEGCGRDVKGFSLCKECRQYGYKRAAESKDTIPFPGDEWEEYENLIDDEGFDEELKHKHQRPHYDWDCYDQYNRLKKLNKKLKEGEEK